MLNLLTLWGVAVDWRCLLEVNFHASDMPIGTLGPTGALILDGAAALLLLLPLHHFWIAEKPFSKGPRPAIRSGNFWCGAVVLYTVLLHRAWVHRSGAGPTTAAAFSERAYENNPPAGPGVKPSPCC